jgi:RND family efflux transporter MFP subunit
MKRLFWIVLILLALGLAARTLSRAFIPASAYAHATPGTVKKIVTGSVTISAAAESQIASPEDGLVLPANFLLKEGSTVTAGDVLARLDPGQIPFEQKEAQINLDQAASRLAGKLQSEIDLQRMQNDLADKKKESDAGFLGKADYAEYELQVAAQQALATKERSDLESQKSVLENSLANYADQLKRLDITAPYDGVVTAVLAHPGDVLSKGQPVANLISRELKIAAEVNQDDIAYVQPGETADIHFFAFPEQIPAKVKLVLPSSDKTTQRFTVLLEVTNSPVPLFSGLTGEVGFLAGEHDHVLRVPRRALYNNSLFIANHGRVEVRPVTPGFLTLTQAEIKSGVTEGEIVLTENLDLLRNGDPISLTTDEDATK